MVGERGLRRRVVALAAVVLTAATALTAIAHAPRAAAVLPSPFTGAFITSDDGTRTIAAADVHVMNPTGTDAAVFTLGATGPVDIDFEGPAGSPITPGVYAVVLSPADPSLGLGGSVQCAGLSGEYLVDDVAYDGSGNLLTFAARFHVSCQAGGRVQGAVSYNSTADYWQRALPNLVQIGPVVTGSSGHADVLVKNEGQSPLNITSVTVGGAGAAEFDVTDQCSGSTLAVGQQCPVNVRFEPTSKGRKILTLTVVDDFAPWGQVITVRGQALTLARFLEVDDGSHTFFYQRVGTFFAPWTVHLKNDGNTDTRISRIAILGDYFDFPATSTCDRVLEVGTSCEITVYFVPTRRGTRNAKLNVYSNATNGTIKRIALTGEGTLGYYLARSGGQVSAFGDALPYGGADGVTAPVVAMATTPNGDGYWLFGRDGRVYTKGNAPNAGSLLGRSLARPIVGATGSATGKGYWMVASDGGIFAIGDARFYGSTGAIRLNQPIVGMATTTTGKGYWLVASDGGIFAFGDAKFRGSTGAMRLNKPIVGMSVTPSGRGYWLVASDGGIFAFGDAHFYGSTGNIALTSPIVGMSAAPDGRGYWFVARDGGLFSYGPSIAFYGSLGGQGLNDVVAMAGTAPPLTWLYADRAHKASTLSEHLLGSIRRAWVTRSTS